MISICLSANMESYIDLCIDISEFSLFLPTNEMNSFDERFKIYDHLLLIVNSSWTNKDPYFISIINHMAIKIKKNKDFESNSKKLIIWCYEQKSKAFN